MRVEALMTTDVVTVVPETSLKAVARILTARGISGVPVCSGDGAVLGVVSEADILLKEQGLADGEERLSARTAAEAMSKPAVTVSPSASVAEAARSMITRRINRLPVVDHGLLVGIVTRADLVRAFHRSDDEIARELREDVVVHTLWISPDDVDISVADGIVSLAGTLDSRTQAELVTAYARRVPGVVDVRSDLSWRTDDQARRRSVDRPPHRVRGG